MMLSDVCLSVSGGCSGGEWERVGGGKLLLRCRLLGSAMRFGAHGEEERGGGDCGGGSPTACYRLLVLSD